MLTAVQTHQQPICQCTGANGTHAVRSGYSCTLRWESHRVPSSCALIVYPTHRVPYTHTVTLSLPADNKALSNSHFLSPHYWQCFWRVPTTTAEGRLKSNLGTSSSVPASTVAPYSQAYSAQIAARPHSLCDNSGERGAVRAIGRERLLGDLNTATSPAAGTVNKRPANQNRWTDFKRNNKFSRIFEPSATLNRWPPCTAAS